MTNCRHRCQLTWVYHRGPRTAGIYIDRTTPRRRGTKLVPVAPFLPSPHPKMRWMPNPEGKRYRLITQTHVAFSSDTLPSPKNHSVATSIFAIRVAVRIPRNGERYARHPGLFDWPLTSLAGRVPMALKLFAMPVASDGQRKCANMRRPPRQATRVRFPSTTSYPLSLVATALPVFYEGFMIWDTS